MLEPPLPPLATSLGKLFHKILAIRLENYLVSNSMVDKSIQKGFLRGVNGCIEHVFAIQSMLVNAMEHSLPLTLSFIDLKNAFGSISHAYITNILRFIRLPPKFTNYVSNLYSSISAQHLYKELEDTILSNQQGSISGGHTIPTSVFDSLQSNHTICGSSSKQRLCL